jgi:hypothetical protein
VRVNATQRPERQPAEIERLGHVVLGTTRFRAALDWCLDTLGLIVSDFTYLDGQRERGPVMAFLSLASPPWESGGASPPPDQLLTGSKS